MNPITQATKRHDNPSTSIDDTHTAAASTDRSTLEAITGGLLDAARDLSDDLSQSARELREEVGATIAGYQHELENLVALPGHRLQDLEENQAEVGEISVSLSAKAGVGAGGEVKAEYEILRSGPQQYEATLRGNIGADIGLGEEFADQGISLDATGDAHTELKVVAHGEQGAEALAEALENPTEFASIVRDSPYLELSSLTISKEAGASANVVGFGTSISAENIRGFVRHDDELHPVTGQRVKGSVGLDTPSITYEDRETAVREMERACNFGLRDFGIPPGTVPTEVYRQMAELNGNMVGLKAELSASVEYTKGITDDVPPTVKVNVEATLGERSVRAEASVTIDSSTPQGRAIAKHIANNDLEAARKEGLELKWKVDTTSFSGTDIDLPFISRRFGTQTVEELYRGGLKLN